MEAYKYATTVQPDGVLKIPELNEFANQKVEVLVVLKPE